jgi:hypothetical protein
MKNPKCSPLTNKVAAQVSYSGVTYVVSALRASGEQNCFEFWEIYVSGPETEKVFVVSVARRTKMTQQKLEQYVVGFVFDGKI